MIRKLASGEYRLYSRKVNQKTGKRRNLGTFRSRAAAEKHEREVQYFKRHWRAMRAVPCRGNKNVENNPMHSSQVVEISICGFTEIILDPSGKTGA